MSIFKHVDIYCYNYFTIEAGRYLASARKQQEMTYFEN